MFRVSDTLMPIYVMKIEDIDRKAARDETEISFKTSNERIGWIVCG
jgi:hypothetical protein